MSVKSLNPYAPPESAAGGFRFKGDPKSYRIHGDLLHVANGATLPDVCLETGRVEGGMTRGHQVLRSAQPDRNYLYLALGLFLGVGVLRLLFVPWLIIAGFLIYLFFRRSIDANLCSSREARVRQKCLAFAKWVVVASVGAFIAFAPFDPLERFVFGLTIGLMSQFFLRKLDQSFRVVEIKDGEAILSRVHPEALMQLIRWRREHLSKLLPEMTREMN